MKELLYIHTLDGYPAQFDGFQVAHIGKKPIVPVDMRAIEKERKTSIQNRKDNKMVVDTVYGQFAVRLP